MPNQLPQPSSSAQAVSHTLRQHIFQAIDQHDGWIPFSHFMQLALYSPQYGYYTGGSHKIGASGDFITAPTLSPLFGQTLARQLQSLLPQTAGNVYEFGAGTGNLAATLLNALSGSLSGHYYIIELSPELAERQRQHILAFAPDMADKVIHLAELPASLDGIVIGNEVLDAIPCEVVQHQDNEYYQMGVCHNGQHFAWQQRPIVSPTLAQLAEQYFPANQPYTSELHPAQYAFIHTLSEKLTCGAIIMIDYGFDAAQYYHSQRDQGTLIGHYRHHSIHNPFYWVGLTDLPAHINFTDIAQAGTDAGLDLIGYTTQAHFLLNLGITEILEAKADTESVEYIREASNIHKLVGQHEMGELFKVIAFGRDIDIDWQGFHMGDICHKL